MLLNSDSCRASIQDLQQEQRPAEAGYRREASCYCVSHLFIYSANCCYELDTCMLIISLVLCHALQACGGMCFADFSRELLLRQLMLQRCINLLHYFTYLFTSSFCLSILEVVF